MSAVTLPFLHPTTILVAGPTRCGKTEFMVQFLSHRSLQPFPERIVWVYSEWQDAYDRILNLNLDGTKVQFVKGVDTNELYESISPKVRNLVVLDDQMENEDMHRKGGTTLAKFFTQGSHHRNLTIVYIVQNLFHQSRAMRTVSLNTHYMVLFKIPRDKTQVRTLAGQMYPLQTNFLTSSYDDATSRRYGYLVIDLRPDTPEALRVRTNVFDESPGNVGPVIYVPTSALHKGVDADKIANTTRNSAAVTMPRKVKSKVTKRKAVAVKRKSATQKQQRDGFWWRTNGGRLF